MRLRCTRQKNKTKNAGNRCAQICMEVTQMVNVSHVLLCYHRVWLKASSLSKRGGIDEHTTRGDAQFHPQQRISPTFRGLIMRMGQCHGSCSASLHKESHGSQDNSRAKAMAASSRAPSQQSARPAAFECGRAAKCRQQYRPCHNGPSIVSPTSERLTGCVPRALYSVDDVAVIYRQRVYSKGC